MTDTPNRPPLSPAAQTVINAAGRRYAIDGSLQDSIAAALRAAAVYSYCPVDRQRLFAIAAELDGHV